MGSGRGFRGARFHPPQFSSADRIGRGSAPGLGGPRPGRPGRGGGRTAHFFCRDTRGAVEDATFLMRVGNDVRRRGISSVFSEGKRAGSLITGNALRAHSKTNLFFSGGGAAQCGGGRRQSARSGCGMSSTDGLRQAEIRSVRVRASRPPTRARSTPAEIPRWATSHRLARRPASSA